MAKCKECGEELTLKGNVLVCENCGKKYKAPEKMILAAKAKAQAEAKEAKKAAPAKKGPKCKACGEALTLKGNVLVCENCGKKYKAPASMLAAQEEEAEEKKAAPAKKGPKCKACGEALTLKGNVLVCENCGKKYKAPASMLAAQTEEKEEEKKEAPAKKAPKCKACGEELTLKGNILVCENCGKKYKAPASMLAAQAEEEKKDEDIVIEEPKAVEPVEAPVVAPVVVETPVEEPVQAPIVEPVVVETPIVEPVVVAEPVKEEAPVATSSDLASIAKSLNEINETLKALLEANNNK